MGRRMVDLSFDGRFERYILFVRWLRGQLFGRVFALCDSHSSFRDDVRPVAIVDWVDFYLTVDVHCFLFLHAFMTAFFCDSLLCCPSH